RPVVGAQRVRGGRFRGSGPVRPWPGRSPPGGGNRRLSALVRILRFTRSLTPYYVGIMLVAAVTTGASLAVPFLTGRATDVIVAAVGGERETPDAVRTVLLLAAAVLAAELLNSIVSNIGGYWGDVMSAKMRTILSVRY